MIFTFLRSFFSLDLLVELSERKILISVFSSDAKYEDEPYMAIEMTDKGEIVKAIGSEARSYLSSNIRITNPFKHPRSFVADFMVAEKIIQHGISQIHKSRFRIRPAPRVIMHQLEKVEGGLTLIEERVLRELAVGAGAREVVVYLGAKINTNVDSFDSIKSRVSAT